MIGSSFTVDVAATRDRVRQKMDRGPVAETHGTDPAKVVEIKDADDILDLPGSDADSS